MDRFAIGRGWDSAFPDDPLVGFLVLPSFLGANWLSPTSTGDGIGGGIFHAVSTIRLYDRRQLDGESEQPEARVAKMVGSEREGRNKAAMRCDAKRRRADKRGGSGTEREADRI